MQAYFILSKISIDDGISPIIVKTGTIYIPSADIKIIPRNGTLPGITEFDGEEFKHVLANPTTYREISYSKKDLAHIKKVQRVQDEARRSIDSLVNRAWKTVRQASQ